MNKRKYICITCILFFMVLGISKECSAVDPSVYWGTWKCQKRERQIEIEINRFSINIIINNNKFNKVEFEYVYAKRAETPFLYIRAVEEIPINKYKYYEHIFYLILGADRKYGTDKWYSVIKGFYEFNKILNNEYEEAESVSYPMEFIKIED